MDELELLREMEAQNSWWSSGAIKLEEGLIERSIFKNILGELDKKEVTGIVGLRRIGKTTILKQLIRRLLEKGVDAKHILFLSFDNFKKEERAIKQVLDAYAQHVLETTYDKIKSTVYVFFDEIQKVNEWGEEIKSFYEKGYKIKFFVSGSSSMNILRGSGESLVGRINIHKMLAFSFKEFLEFNGVETDKLEINTIKYPRKSDDVLAMFSKYARVGGFPELYKLSEQEIKIKLRTFVDLTFYRDIVNIFEIKRPDVIEGLFFAILKESGNVANYNNLSNALNTKFETLKSYIEYMAYSFIISQSRFFSRSRKTIEKNPKIYVSDHSFFNLAQTEEGLRVETMVYNHCRLLAESGEFDGASYWSDKYNEVDIILTQKNKILPIEVKYREDPKSISGLLKFMELFKIKKGIVITKDMLEEKTIDNKKIQFIPAWLFLLVA